MGRLLIGQSEAVGRFVAERSPIERPEWGNFVGLGILRSNGTMVAGIVFNSWQPECRRIELSGAADDPRAFSTRILGELAAYVFGQLSVHRVYAKTSIDNRRALKLLEGLGFIREGTLASWYGPDLHAVMLRVTEPEWRRKWGAVPLKEAA
jgi:RimJ/RimL family protein N-acetyltransferase